MCANKADSDSNSDCCWFSLAGKITNKQTSGHRSHSYE